ncbi:ABC transporter permease [Parvibaculum sp.]|uniref:ABC transporter permease n=1 Tax=Parvibaculum sp. TaxID=2024848 RepID=UPI00272F7CA1|nr:ABC transporter permease [Parvibaculum sp.]MDP1626991.1 ABC transporter permease [Parvibaculum sp.]MDP2149785.1 ABC transporter permease [Parvibaculum sp.]MDP3327229.1 ABC transporter permease [Parvibaculum sp.]
MRRFSLFRLGALIRKEFIQMRRDRLTFAMMLGVPVMQLVLFGYAINSDPKHLPTALFSQDHSVFTRTLVKGLENSDYFDIVGEARTAAEAEDMIRTGKVQFVVQIPPGFSRDMQRGQRPQLLLDADATDPAATGNAVAGLQLLATTVFNRDLQGSLAAQRAGTSLVDVVIHRRYNAEGRTELNIVPGLIGVILTMTMIIFTALAMTREIERGTMENLLTMPVRPLEVMMGKILPYIMIGYIQTAVVLAAAYWLFEVPIVGSLWLLSFVLFFFVAANLAVGFTFSTLARNQLQAIQMTIFFFLPSILLSGFMFPFRGMPVWAQWLGEVLPLTHFLRMVRGILLKGNGFAEIVPDMAALLAFLVGVSIVALNRYRQTLD